MIRLSSQQISLFLLTYALFFCNITLVFTKEFRYLKALPCSGVYSPGGVHTEYLRFLRLKQEVQIDETGYVRAERDDLTSFYLGPTRMMIEDCDLGSDKCVVRQSIPVPIRSVMSDDIEAGLNLALHPDRSNILSTRYPLYTLYIYMYRVS